MSKHRPYRDESPKPPVPPSTKPANGIVPPVRDHRKCPSCWGVHKGKGIREWSRPVSGRQVKTCYQCDQCGYNWTVVVETVRRIVEIEDRKVQVEHDDPPELDTR